MMQSPDARLLEIRGLEVTFAAARGRLEAIRGVDLEARSGETLGLVGESGCGKSVTMLAVMGLLPPSVQIRGSIRFRGMELAGRPQKELAKLRGASIGMIFQDPMTALNPVLTIGAQIAEAIRIHDATVSARVAAGRAVDMLKLVTIPYPERRALQYPHELSGGMRQRAMIAMAMANEPELLIADEPTTALDVTCRRRSSNCCGDCRRLIAWAWFLSATTSASSPAPPTGSPSCMPAASSSAGRLRTSSIGRAIPIRAACSPRCRRSMARPRA
jgi:ABC-type dipeptide/oligopeptide/nickel transport system ATPase component